MRTKDDRVLVVVPVLGHHEMTHELLGDLRREADVADVVVVDNGGDYPIAADEAVLRPGENLGWAAGTNAGTTAHRRPEHAGAVWLNNDTRLAPGHLAGLLTAWRDTAAGVVGPFYDCYWPHQRVPDVALARYRPQRRHFRVPFVDGTCMFVAAATLDRIGLLDAETFGPVGWGAEIDYSLRARAAGLPVVVTRLAYLHHERSTTGKTAFAGGLEEYASVGYPALVEGMARKWGDDWRERAGLDAVTGQTRPVGWRDRVRRRRGAP
jgi:GT2 family glycosyltransferase